MAADRGGGRARRTTLIAVVGLAGLLGLAALGVLVDVLPGGADRPARSTDAVRLGPEPGQPVVEYLAGLPARLPPPGAPPVPALTQFAEGQDAPSAARLLAGVPGVRPVTSVFRVPLPRVQTALRFQPLPPVDLPDPVATLVRRFALAQAAAERDADSAAHRLTGRSASVARYEAGALAAEPPCRCVLAVLVLADHAGLSALAGNPAVRAVDAAPPDTPVTAVALAPLLPEQTTTATPPLDTAPIPGG